MNGLELELEEALLVIRVDIQSPAGVEVSRQFTSRTTPTFIFFDPEGNEIWRSIGTLDPDKVRSSIEAYN